MLRWVARIYARRIVNINVNIILAGLLALPVVLVILRIANTLGLTEEHKALVSVITFVADIVADVTIYFILHWLANHSPWRRKELEDVAVAADHLHLFTEKDGKQAGEASEANVAGAAGADGPRGPTAELPGSIPPPGLRPRRKLTATSAEALRFLKEATIVQIERAALSPLLYVLWLGTQQYLLRRDHSMEFSTVAGFCVAIGIVRTIHTVWMIRKDHRAAVEARRAGSLATKLPSVTSAAGTPVVMPPVPRPSPAGPAAN
ncbi:MAG: hypothetical protein ACT4PL_14230 [Phycisphaerales bacterium]